MQCRANRRRWMLQLFGLCIGLAQATTFARDPSPPLTKSKQAPRPPWAVAKDQRTRTVIVETQQSEPIEKPQPESIDFPAPESILDHNVFLIDLPSALRLAGVRNSQILLSRERITEADAVRQLAASRWLPNINAGSNYDTHTGPLQQSTGQIIDVNRNSLYLGLGASAVGGGTVTIPGVTWNNNLSETYYGVLITRQVVRQRGFAADAVNNDMLLRVATGYVELLRAGGRRAVVILTREDAQELARVTAAYARAGQGRQADADRAATELEQRNAEFFRAEAEVLTASARLCQLLNLDPSTRLQPVDAWVVPSPVVPDPVPLCELIAIALTQRPELGERREAVQEAFLFLRGAKLLPFSPNVIVGYSSGAFGGGSNLADTQFGHFKGRQDFDTVVYWTIRNLGVGNAAQIRLADSRLRVNNYRQLEVLDRVRAEVAIAHARTHARYAQISAAERAVKTAETGFKADLRRTRNQEGLPIEVLNSLNLLGRSRQAYLDAICDYNRAQFELYVALGQPPADVLARPVPTAVGTDGATGDAGAPGKNAQP